MEGVLRAWGLILRGYAPNLSIEITRECPLRCPGCYAYGDEHLGGGLTLRQVSDLKGEALVNGVLDLVRTHRPLHVSLVGGEPLVRHRELGAILPRLADMGVYTQVVTSAVRPIPQEWAGLRRLQVAVSVDGLQPEHDARRSPATYERILKHIAGHQVTVHCTVTREQAAREGYVSDFLRFWSANPDVRRVWFSLYSPQLGESSPEMLTGDDRRRVLEELRALRPHYPKLELPNAVIEGYLRPPASPAECIFARTTTCVSADLEHPITPCQFGGQPDCSQCGCLASAALAAVGRYRTPGGVTAGQLFEASERVGSWVRGVREGRWRRARPVPHRAPALTRRPTQQGPEPVSVAEAALDLPPGAS
jgi:MoaA/NifB/PqqE/SkfB family radical SAM enzyme